MSALEAGGGRLGAFDTDAAALKRRIEAHSRYGSRDLNPWVLEQLELADGHRVLELGCGTGKQTVPIAEIVGATGHVLAVDASAEALSQLGHAASERGVDRRIDALRADFDTLDDGWEADFDRALSSYALYYAEHPRRLMEAIERGLRAGGIFFFCGPSGRNNAELKGFCDALRDDVTTDADEAKIFMERTGVGAARALFAEVDLLEFENPLRFDSAESLCEYWTSYNLFDPDIEEAFRSAAAAHFENNEVFETVKRVRGVRARKGGN